MADVLAQFKIDTDQLLEGLDVEWEVGVRTVSRWNVLSDDEQLVFVMEWAIPRGYFQELDERCRAGELSREQLTRFDELRRWFSEHRAAIETVLEDSAI